MVKTDNWLQEETIGLEPYSLTLNVEFRHKKGAFQAKMASNFKFINRAHKPACAQKHLGKLTHIVAKSAKSVSNKERASLFAYS